MRNRMILTLSVAAASVIVLTFWLYSWFYPSVRIIGCKTISVDGHEVEVYDTRDTLHTWDGSVYKSRVAKSEITFYENNVPDTAYSIEATFNDKGCVATAKATRKKPESRKESP